MLSAKAQLGRATRFEIHRFNFIGGEEQSRQALAELGRQLRMVFNRSPDLAFLSGGKLESMLKERDRQSVEPRIQRGLHVGITRPGDVPRRRKLARASGCIVSAERLGKWPYE